MNYLVWLSDQSAGQMLDAMNTIQSKLSNQHLLSYA